MSYTITLSDGSKLENLRANGNNFIADYPITEDTFKYKLASVEIESDEPPSQSEDVPLGRHENMQLMGLQHGLAYMNPDEYWFVIAPITEEQMRYAEMRSNIDYIAMMTDVDL